MWHYKLSMLNDKTWFCTERYICIHIYAMVFNQLLRLKILWKIISSPLQNPLVSNKFSFSFMGVVLFFVLFFYKLMKINILLQHVCHISPLGVFCKHNQLIVTKLKLNKILLWKFCENKTLNVFIQSTDVLDLILVTLALII